MFDFLTDRFSSTFSRLTGQANLSEKNLQETIATIRDSFLEADVPLVVVDTFIDDVTKEVVGQKVLKSLKPGEQFIKIVHEKLKSYLIGDAGASSFDTQARGVTMVMGLQGAGKTTTIAKLAAYIQAEAKHAGKLRRVLLASVDYYRPAAIDQLEILAKSIDAGWFRAESSSPIEAAREIHQHYVAEQYDILLLDTAGRLHVDGTMLTELREIDALVQPKTKLLVLDAMTGQESLRVAEAFDQGVGFHGAFMAKMDSDTRGGAAFAFRYSLDKPVWFVGVGEKVDEIEVFHPERMATRILGMGDIESLIEKADRAISAAEQKSAEKAFMSGKMTLEDFAKQMSMVERIGSFSSVLKMMPGGLGAKMTPDMVEKGEREVKKFKAIISSMTLKERKKHRLLDGSRKKRVAKGAGVAVSDINQLLERFEQSQQFVKLLKNGNFKNLFK